MLYATPVHAVRDVHHVSDYHTIAEESVRFDPIGRLPSYHVARLTTKRNPATKFTGHPVDQSNIFNNE